MTVDSASPSATNLIGSAVSVDLLATTFPPTKVAVAVLLRLMLSVTSTAEMVLTSALVDLILAVN